MGSGGATPGVVGGDVVGLQACGGEQGGAVEEHTLTPVVFVWEGWGVEEGVEIVGGVYCVLCIVYCMVQCCDTFVHVHSP